MSRARTRTNLLRWITGGLLAVGVTIALAVAVWPASAADKAYDDGQAFGQAATALYEADTSEEVDAALTDLDQAAADTRDHATDEVADQVSDQEDALSRAADGFVGVNTSDDSFSVDVYQAELNDAVDDLADNTDDFRSDGPEVQRAFWDGVDAGRTTTA